MAMAYLVASSLGFWCFCAGAWGVWGLSVWGFEAYKGRLQRRQLHGIHCSLSDGKSTVRLKEPSISCWLFDMRYIEQL